MSDKIDNLTPFDATSKTEEKTQIQSNAPVFDTAVFAVDFAKGVRRFWALILILGIIFGSALAHYRYVTYTPMYESSVSFSVTAMTFSSSGATSTASYYDNASAKQLSTSFPYIVGTSMMQNAIKSELNTDTINGSISTAPVATDSNIFRVVVTSNSPQDAYDIVNAVIKVYPNIAKFVVGNIELNILIKPTLPATPYTSNNVLRAGAIGVIGGAGLACAFIALLAFFRRTIRKKEDFKEKLNQKCLVEVPYIVNYRRTRDKNSAPTIVRITGRAPIFKESFRLLRKRLAKNLEPGEKIIAVTSAAPGEGKTTVAVNMAHAFALSHNRVAVVDMDIMRRPLQKYLPPEGEEELKGFSELILSKSTDFDSIAYKNDDHLYFFYAGNDEIQFTVKAFDRFFAYLRANYDYVFVNTAPGGDVSNVVSVCNLCDCIVGVVKQDTVSIDKIRKTLEYLSYSTAKIKGFVFNGVAEGFTGYGGYYYGGKYGYGKYGYGKYGYGKYGYGRYGYGHKGYGYGYGRRGYGYGYGHSYGYGYGYGYGEEPEQKEKRKFSLKFKKNNENKEENVSNDIESKELIDNIDEMIANDNKDDNTNEE